MPIEVEDGSDRSRARAQGTTEDAPLLAAAGDFPDDDVAEESGTLYLQNVLILCFAILFLVDFGANLLTPPLNAIMEDVICRQYHPDAYGSVQPNDPDSICKGQDVQKQLAMIRGWSATFDCVPGIITAIPYGILSDSWGRRPVLFLSLLGINFQILLMILILGLPNIFPVWSLLGTSFAMFIGGGGSMATAMLYTVVSDVVPLANRATIFFQLMACALLAVLIATPTAGFLLERSMWLAYIIGAALLIVSNFAVLVVPETKHVHEKTRLRNIAERNGNGHATADERQDGQQKKLLQQLGSHIGSSAKEAWHFAKANKGAMSLILTLAFTVIGRWVQEMLLQYATRRFHWSWSKATYLLAVGNASNIAVLMLILPGLSWLLLERLHMSALVKDLVLARMSGLLLIIGSLIIALAVNGYVLALGLVVMSCGIGISSLIRSLASALVEQHHVGILNTLIGLMDQIALMLAGPILSASLNTGFSMGGIWVGLPFFASAGLFSIAFVVTLVFRLPKRPVDEPQAAEEGEASGYRD